MTQLGLSNRVLNIKPSATLGMAQAARELSEKGIDVAILSAGEPNFATPKAICDVAKASIDEGRTHYAPVRGSKALVSAMREKFSRDQKVDYAADEVLCTVGAKSAIWLALMAMINEGDEVIVFAPYWVSYVEQVRLAGGVPVIVDCHAKSNLMPNGDDLARAITKKTKAVILNSPSNPTGSVITKPELLELARVLRGTSIWLISDEIYEKLLFDNNVHYSPASLNPDMRERTIVISGVSKAYAMTGWRVGIAAGHKSIITGMMDLQGQQATCLPEFVQDAAAYALREDHVVAAQINHMVEAYQHRRDLALSLFSQLPNVSIFKPSGAFYLWVDFSHYVNKELKGKVVVSDIDFATRMLKEAHVASVPGTPFGAPGFLRFSIASAEKDIEKAKIRLEEWLLGDDAK